MEILVPILAAAFGRLFGLFSAALFGVASVYAVQVIPSEHRLQVSHASGAVLGALAAAGGLPGMLVGAAGGYLLAHFVEHIILGTGHHAQPIFLHPTPMSFADMERRVGELRPTLRRSALAAVATVVVFRGFVGRGWTFLLALAAAGLVAKYWDRVEEWRSGLLP